MSQCLPSVDDPHGQFNAAASRLIPASGAAQSPIFRQLLWLSEAKLPPECAVAAGAIDWQALISLAYAQRMLPMVHERIMAQAPEQAWVRQHTALLRAAHLDNARHNLALAAEALRLLDALEAAGAPALAFKGCVLGYVAYGNLASRKGGDIDLLVKKENLKRAAETLAACGYRSYEERSPARAIGHQAFDCEWEWFNAAHGTGVDLHWRFSGTNVGLPILVERFWSRTQIIAFLGRKIRAFAPEDLVLMLCVHHAKHHWQRLEWIYTLAKTINRLPALNWASLQNESILSGTDRILRLGLLLADDIYGVNMPDETREWVLKDDVAKSLAQKSLRWLAKGEHEAPSSWQRHQYNAETRLGAARRAYYWLCAAATPNAKDFIIKLPRALHWGYFVIRAARMCVQGLARLILPQPAPPPSHSMQWIPKPAILRSSAGLASSHGNGEPAPASAVNVASRSSRGQFQHGQ